LLIEERDIFPIFKEQNMLIMQTPSFMAPSILGIKDGHGEREKKKFPGKF
jgi:hypothetical protein